VETITCRLRIDIPPQAIDIRTQIYQRADRGLARRKFDRHGRSSHS
jgi:hypothetical protein